MDGRFLHEGERLLVNCRASPAALILGLLRGVLEAVSATVGVSLLIVIVTFFLGVSLPFWIYVVLLVLLLGGILYQHVRIWHEATLRVTTERILVANPAAFFHAPLTTIKWTQYQEGEVGHRHFLDLFFLARPLHIRYGTADAKYEAHFPSLRYAEDLKHYLDKTDSAVRRNDLQSLKAFVAKPRGKRDVAAQDHV